MNNKNNIADDIKLTDQDYIDYYSNLNKDNLTPLENFTAIASGMVFGVFALLAYIVLW